MLSLVDKIKMVPGLLPMLLEGQSFIDAQDELSVLDFMRKYGMPERARMRFQPAPLAIMACPTVRGCDSNLRPSTRAPRTSCEPSSASIPERRC